MSGIAAIFGNPGKGQAPVSIAAMANAMAYLGPGGIAEWQSGNCAIAHAALHTMAEMAATPQPLRSAGGQVVLAMDGYFANHEELLAQLRARSHVPRSLSDAELALCAYEAWGADMAEKLEGEFAIVLWDARQQEALCLRDHHGLRPLYYHWDGATLLASSDLGAILAALPQAPPYNLNYLAEAALDVAFTGDETIWRDIYRLPAAHILRLRGGRIGLHEYWTLPLEVDLIYRRDEDYFAHYREVFSECVRRAARSDRPVACEVSGGLDSSGVFAIAHHLRASAALPAPGLRGYTLAGPAGSEADELSYARAVGRHWGEAITENPLFMPEADWFAARAVADCDLPPFPNAAMSIGLEKSAAEDGCRVLLSGIGGDQWLDGARFYHSELIRRADWRQMRACFRADAEAFGFRRASLLLAKGGPGSLIPFRLRRILRGLLPAEAEVNEALECLLPQFRSILAERQAQYEAGFPQDYRSGYKLRKLKYPRWSRVLDSVTRQRARSGLEMRSPMLSRAFIEFSARTPEHLRLRGGTTKFIHRGGLHGLLPDEVLHRRSKAEFSTAFFAHDEELLRFSRAGPGAAAEDLLIPEATMQACAHYLSTPVDERCTGAIWGLYEVSLMLLNRPAIVERDISDG